MLLIATLPHKKDQFYCHLKKSLLEFKNDPILSMLDVDLSEIKEAFSAMERNNSPDVSVFVAYTTRMIIINTLYVQDTAEVMKAIFNAKVKSVFYKLNIHAGTFCFVSLIH